MTMLKGAWYNKNRISLRRKKRMFNLIEMLFPIMFILIFIIIVFTFVKGIATWFKNNNSPRLTVSARIPRITINQTLVIYQEHMDFIQFPAPRIM